MSERVSEREKVKTNAKIKKRIHLKKALVTHRGSIQGSGMREMPQMDGIEQAIQVDVTAYNGNSSSE